MRTRWTHLGGQPVEAIEVVVTGPATSLEVNVLAAESPRQAPSLPAEQPVQDAVEAPPPEVSPEPQDVPIPALADVEAVTVPEEVSGPEYSRGERVKMGTVRTVKTLVFTVGGEASVYVVNNLAGLNLPPGIGLAVGAAAYGVNKFYRPDNGGIL